MPETLNEFSPDYAVKPGESLREVMYFAGLSLNEFAASFWHNLESQYQRKIAIMAKGSA